MYVRDFAGLIEEDWDYWRVFVAIHDEIHLVQPLSKVPGMGACE
jgi:hypothetical protein